MLSQTWQATEYVGVLKERKSAHWRKYNPFGKIVVQTGYYADTNPFRFSSEYYDKETGLVAYLYRYYSPDYCRFLSREPIEEWGGYYLYQYVNNNPINKWDYLGLADKCCDEILTRIEEVKKSAINAQKAIANFGMRGGMSREELLKWLDDTNMKASTVLGAVEITEQIWKHGASPAIKYGIQAVTTTGMRANLLNPGTQQALGVAGKGLTGLGMGLDAYSTVENIRNEDYMEATRSASSFSGGALALSTTTVTPWAAPVIGIGALSIWGGEKIYDKYLSRKERQENLKFRDRYRDIYLNKIEKLRDLIKEARDNNCL